MMLSEPVVRRVHAINPDLRVVLILRDPIDRECSAIKRGVRNGSLRGTSTEDMIQFVDGEDVTKRSDYVNAIATWKSVFGTKQFFIGYYDQVMECPDSLLTSIFHFLEVDPGRSTSQSLNVKVNAGGTVEIPLEVKLHLARKHIQQLHELESRLGSYTCRWRQHAEQILNSARSGAA